jgi:hypothetical protein
MGTWGGGEAGRDEGREVGREEGEDGSRFERPGLTLNPSSSCSSSPMRLWKCDIVAWKTSFTSLVSFLLRRIMVCIVPASTPTIPDLGPASSTKPTPVPARDVASLQWGREKKGG